MKQFYAEIVRIISIAKDYYELTFTWPKILDPPFPGQFLNLRCSEGTSPLLRRPFAFSGFNTADNTASVIFQKRGPGTEILAGKKNGESLDILAPLGNRFIPTPGGSLHILVSGGIGFGPLYYFAAFLKESGEKYIFIHGSREASFIPAIPRLADLDPILCTEDGSAGFKGATTDYLTSLEISTLRTATIYACGPLPMLKTCHLVAENHNATCYVSMEQIMGCGFGACMGCVVKTTLPPGFARVCTEGPVFSSRDIIWN